jgi:hypothetical protein
MDGGAGPRQHQFIVVPALVAKADRLRYPETAQRASMSQRREYCPTVTQRRRQNIALDLRKHEGGQRRRLRRQYKQAGTGLLRLQDQPDGRNGQDEIPKSIEFDERNPTLRDSMTFRLARDHSNNCPAPGRCDGRCTHLETFRTEARLASSSSQ